MPKPLRPEGVPIWVSGTIRSSTVRRLTRHGARWIPWGADAANLGEAIPRIKEALAAAGGDAEGLQVSGHLPIVKGDDGEIDLGRTMEGAVAQVEKGVTCFVGSLRLPADQGAAEAKLHPIVEAFRAAVGREPV
jgi:alkanesulfonate monooxygenase SsuD/methylene tetrahydromethanopterin reductase-like flavin-dependent oxidoreductase (luciferase family)